jgi:hypothetical protein
MLAALAVALVAVFITSCVCAQGDVNSPVAAMIAM